MKQLSNFEIMIKIFIILLISLFYTVLLSSINLYFIIINPLLIIILFYCILSLEKNGMLLRGEIK